MKELEVKGYTKENNIVVSASGMQAFMLLTTLLWQDKTNINKCKIEDCKIEYNYLQIKTNEFTYVFKNIPLQWDSNIDTSKIYMKHIENLKESEVITI